jgi:hypothetical protein
VSPESERNRMESVLRGVDSGWRRTYVSGGGKKNDVTWAKQFIERGREQRIAQGQEQRQRGAEDDARTRTTRVNSQRS